LSEEDRIATAAASITRAVGALLTTARPEELYVVSGLDSHPDHAALNAIVVDMLAAGAIDCPVYEYPVWFWADRHAARRWLAGVGRTARKIRHARGGYFAPVAVRTDLFLAQKRHALDAHTTQVTSYRTDEPWPTLQDIDDGRWLERFFGPREIFFPRG
jgi:LmbE family N-acetylglucosaminyl deacetylase